MSSAVDTLRSAVNPSPRLDRIRDAALFEFGLFLRSYPRPIVRVVNHYLSHHSDQTFLYCAYSEAPAGSRVSVALVVLSRRLLNLKLSLTTAEIVD
mgnify:CR=1 FL=1